MLAPYQQMGNLPSASLSQKAERIFGGDHARICRAAAECVAGISDPDHRLILMPACDLPPDTPIGNVKEFLSCAD